MATGEAKATATFLSCQPDACWLAAKPAVPAQGKRQLVPGVRQGFPLQRQPTSVFSLNSPRAIPLQHTPIPLAAAQSSHRNWFPVGRFKAQALTWELSEGRLPGSTSLTMCDKYNFKLRRKKKKRKEKKKKKEKHQSLP